MPSAKTECTELLIGFGLLGVHPLNATYSQISRQFQETLSAAKFERLKREFADKAEAYQPLYEIGVSLSQQYPPLQSVTSIYWAGPQQQASTATGAKDLLVNQIPISVKFQSDVVLNPSPYNLFISIPSGSAVAQNADNWYLHTAHTDFQALYNCVYEYFSEDLPADVDEFERTASKPSRRKIQRVIEVMQGREAEEFKQVYVTMCRKVAEESATIFNNNFVSAQRRPIRSSVLEIVARNFFRLDTTRYILCGIDKGNSFAVDIPDLTTWKKRWGIVGVNAVPDLSRNQSIVRFCVTYEDKVSKDRYEAYFHAEIRWSHGKFCGNPEAKLYKEFPWMAVSFLQHLI